MGKGLDAPQQYFFVAPVIICEAESDLDGRKVDLSTIAEGAVGMLVAFESRESALAYMDREPTPMMRTLEKA